MPTTYRKCTPATATKTQFCYTLIECMVYCTTYTVPATSIYICTNFRQRSVLYITDNRLGMFLSQSITCRNLLVACMWQETIIKPGPISTVVQDTISDRHQYANLTWISYNMLLNVKTMTRYSSIPNIYSRCI